MEKRKKERKEERNLIGPKLRKNNGEDEVEESEKEKEEEEEKEKEEGEEEEQQQLCLEDLSLMPFNSALSLPCLYPCLPKLAFLRSLIAFPVSNPIAL